MQRRTAFADISPMLRIGPWNAKESHSTAEEIPSVLSYKPAFGAASAVNGGGRRKKGGTTLTARASHTMACGRHARWLAFANSAPFKAR